MRFSRKHLFDTERMYRVIEREGLPSPRTPDQKSGFSSVVDILSEDAFYWGWDDDGERYEIQLDDEDRISLIEKYVRGYGRKKACALVQGFNAEPTPRFAKEDE